MRRKNNSAFSLYDCKVDLKSVKSMRHSLSQLGHEVIYNCRSPSSRSYFKSASLFVNNQKLQSSVFSDYSSKLKSVSPSQPNLNVTLQSVFESVDELRPNTHSRRGKKQSLFRSQAKLANNSVASLNTSTAYTSVLIP